MGEYFTKEPNVATFDVVWISEAMSHLPNKELFFRNAEKLLNPGGKLVIADWFKAQDLTDMELDADIKPIEGEMKSLATKSLLTVGDGMLLPSLCTQSEYVRYAKDVGFGVFAEPFDISKKVSKTWSVKRLIRPPRPCLR